MEVDNGDERINVFGGGAPGIYARVTEVDNCERINIVGGGAPGIYVRATELHHGKPMWTVRNSVDKGARLFFTTATPPTCAAGGYWMPRPMRRPMRAT